MFAMCLAACLSFGLVGCGTESPANSAAPNSELVQTGTVDPVRMEQQSANGRYRVFDGRRGKPGRICYLDYETAQTTVLCSQPNCSHDSESCTAFVGPNLEETGFYPLPNGRILVFRQEHPENEMPGEEPGTQICTMEPDGSDCKLLAQCPAGVTGLDYLGSDSQWIYLSAAKSNPEAEYEQWLGRVPLEGGEWEERFCFPKGNRQLLGTADRDILLWYREFAGETDENGRELVNQRVDRFSLDSGKSSTVAEWQSPIVLGSGEKEVLWQEDTLYRMNDGASGPLSIQPLHGEARELLVNWPVELQEQQQMNVELEMILKNQLLVCVDAGFDENGFLGDSAFSRRYAIDLSDGSVRELSQNYVDGKGHLLPVLIQPAGKENLLVQLSVQSELVGTIENGVAIQGTEYSSREALISADDFLQGKNNYREFVWPDKL